MDIQALIIKEVSELYGPYKTRYAVEAFEGILKESKRSKMTVEFISDKLKHLNLRRLKAISRMKLVMSKVPESPEEQFRGVKVVKDAHTVLNFTYGEIYAYNRLLNKIKNSE